MTGPAPTPALRARVATIASSIFDAADLAAIQLDDRLRTRCAAVIVLSHAEIEEELEEACRATVDVLEQHPPTGFAFLAWGLSASNINEPTLDDHRKQSKAEGTVKFLTRTYRGIISNSHGIREANLERLLLPLGVNMKLVSIDVATLDSFGRTRGEAAHLSPLKARLQDAPSVVQGNADAAALAADRIVSELASLQTNLKAHVVRRPPKRTLTSWLLHLFGLS